MPATAQAVAPMSPALSAERQHLAEAIARHTAAAAYRDKATATAETAFRARIEIRATIETAEAALREANDKGPRLRLAALLGQPVDEMTPDQARSDLAAANAQLEASEADKALLAEEIARAQAQVTSAERGRDDALAAVLKAEPSPAALLAQLQESRRHIETLSAALEVIFRHGGIESFWNAQKQHDPDPAVRDEWRAALAALTKDAAARLPGE